MSLDFGDFKFHAVSNLGKRKFLTIRNCSDSLDLGRELDGKANPVERDEFFNDFELGDVHVRHMIQRLGAACGRSCKKRVKDKTARLGLVE